MMRGILIKYCERKHAESFQKEGVVHFERLKTFIEQESKNGEHIIADVLEGAVYRNPGPGKTTVTITDPTGKRFVLPAQDVQYNFTASAIENWGVCSFTFLDFEKDFDIIERDNVHATLRVKPSICKELQALSLGSTRVPIIIGAGAFEKRLFKYFHERQEAVRWGPVRYYSLDEEENISSEDYQEDPGKIIFYKSDGYAYEREYRVGLVHPINKKGKNISLGSLTDCVKILDNPGILKNMRVELSDSKQR